MSYFAVRDLSVTFRQFRMREISLSVEQGQTLVLLGPSGAGKSVLLEAIAGFHPLAGGHIELAGHDITTVPPERRGLGFMFQDYALFPHLTVEQNVAFGLRDRRNAPRRVAQVLDLVGGRHLLGRRPATLSGGEKQRVALARALAVEPWLFLLDEPLSALDAVTREELREELRRLLRAVGATSLYVTHDRSEALVLADLIAIVEGGQVRQMGEPEAVFDHPADAWVAEFLGMQVLRPERVQLVGSRRVRVQLGEGALEASANGAVALDTALLAFRPEDVRLERVVGQPGHVEGAVPAVVKSIVPLGPLFRVDLVGGPAFSALLSRQEYRALGLRVSDRVLVRLDPADLMMLPDSRQLTSAATGELVDESRRAGWSWPTGDLPQGEH